MRRVCDFEEERPQPAVIERSIDSKAPPEVRQCFRIIGLRGVDPLDRYFPCQEFPDLIGRITCHRSSIAHWDRGMSANCAHAQVPDRPGDWGNGSAYQNVLKTDSSTRSGRGPT
jgi:hypothetical protein